MTGPRKPSPRLAAHVAASLAGLAMAGACYAAALIMAALGKPGPALAMALAGLACNAARPGPCPDLDKETGAGGH